MPRTDYVMPGKYEEHRIWVCSQRVNLGFDLRDSDYTYIPSHRLKARKTKSKRTSINLVRRPGQQWYRVRPTRLLSGRR